MLFYFTTLGKTDFINTLIKNTLGKNDMQSTNKQNKHNTTNISGRGIQFPFLLQ